MRDGGDEVVPHDDAEVSPIRNAIMMGEGEDPSDRPDQADKGIEGGG